MKLTIFCFALLLSAPAFSQSKKELAAEVTKLKSEIEQLKKPKVTDVSSTVYKKAGYGIGVLIATNIKNSGGDSLDLDAIQEGIKDVWLNEKLKMEKEEAGTLVQDYMQKAAEKKREKAKGENTAWLANNKSKEGVVTTASGLQYKIVKTGTGKVPTATDNVTVNYRGTTIDGVEFDSSEKSGQPASFTVNGVIPGWTEALQLMHAGDKWILYVPSELAYGERGAGNSIAPYSTLIFEVELLKVN